MFAIRMSNRPLNPISYSQLIGWFAWNCCSKVKHFQNNFFHLKLFGKFDLYVFKKTVNTLWSLDLNWGLCRLLKVLELRGFNTIIQLVLLAEWLNSLEKAFYSSLSMQNWRILQKTHQNFMQKFCECNIFSLHNKQNMNKKFKYDILIKFLWWLFHKK